MTFVRRLVALAVVAALVALGIIAAKRPTAPVAASFGTNVAAPMPVAPTGDALTTTWFCPGVPAAADGSASGTFTVLNPSATAALDARLTLVPSQGDPVTSSLQVGPGGRTDIRPAATMKADVVAAMIEVYGTNAVVEQTATNKLGLSTSTCANAASTTWYVADGATTIDATSSLVLFNPFPDEAVATVTFATDEGPRTPQSLKGVVVPAHALRLVDVDQAVLRNTLVSSTVTAKTGRLVVGRLQTYNQKPRRGLVAGLASPVAATEWWFANGRKGQGVAERLVIYNPNDDDADVTVSLFPADSSTDLIDPIEVSVPSGSSTVVDVSGTAAVPDGVHSIRVTTGDGSPGVVVERSLDLTGDGRQATTDQFGARITAPRWYSPTGAPTGGGSVLTVSNATGEDTTFTVSTLGPAGPTPVASASGVALPAGGTVRVDLTQAGIPGAPLLVESADPLVVERLATPSADAPGATSWLGVPER
jgi:hypothetical protein